MLPTYEDYQKGTTTWHGKYRGVIYNIKHHSVFDCQPEGIWCSYLNIYENQAEDFDKFYCEDTIVKWTEDWPFRVENDYFKIPDLGFHGGITYYKNDTYLNPNTGKPGRMIIIGCDYAHSWDRESNFPYDLRIVECDIKGVIDNYINNGYRITEE